MKARERKCEKCGGIEETASKATVCAKCAIEEKSGAKREAERQLIEDMGYVDICLHGYNVHGKPEWTFTHTDCGTEQTWVFGNLQTRIKADLSNVPCSSCGGKRRMQKAMAGYIEKYGRNYNLNDWQDYRQKVRTLTEKTYNANKELINPENHKRMLGNKGHHLDHLIPIITCFHNGISVEAASSIINLKIITAYDNISKGRFGIDDALLKTLRNPVD